MRPPLLPRPRPLLGRLRWETPRARSPPPPPALHHVAMRCPRAPAIVIGYLMKLRSWRLAEAYKWVKDKRPAVNISQGMVVAQTAFFCERRNPRRGRAGGGRGGRRSGASVLRVDGCLPALGKAGRRPPNKQRAAASSLAAKQLFTRSMHSCLPLPSPFYIAQPTPRGWWTWRCTCSTRARCRLGSRQ